MAKEKVFKPRSGGVIAREGMVLVGEAYGCDMTLPARAQVVTSEPEYECRGPGCGKVGSWNAITNWLRTARYLESNRYFCSLRCLANWLAGELAKEEAKDG